jgi:hypothetical protein
MFAQESGMDLQKEREAFENHLKKMGKTDNETFSKNEDDSYQMDIIHFGWKIWQAAIARMEVRINTLDEMLLNQGEALAQAKAQAVPNAKQALHDRLLVKSIREHVEGHISEISVNDLFDKGWLAAMKCIQNNIDMLEAQEPAND